ncbi:MAG: four helix bundle protein [Rickettsiales bacterium]|jgi:four helix bundle protein|nr:four helix bundle protein [Rickettsiales bacterium]
MADSIVFVKSEDFALRIIKLCRFLSEKKKENIISKQIFRSGTSIGANLAESIHGVSDGDFINKHAISQKECEETLYWLRLLKRSDFITEQQFDDIYKDGTEIKKLLASIIKTMKEKHGLKAGKKTHNS